MKLGYGRIIVALCLVFVLASIGYSQRCTEPGSLKQVTTSSIGRFEYVIFTFNKSEEDLNYSTQTASPPFKDYSGDDTIRVRGNRFKKIVFRSINWMCKTRNLTSSRTAVRDVKELWTFEGIAEYAVGFRTGSRYVSTYQYEAGSYTKVVMKFRK